MSRPRFVLGAAAMAAVLALVGCSTTPTPSPDHGASAPATSPATSAASERSVPAGTSSSVRTVSSTHPALTSATSSGSTSALSSAPDSASGPPATGGRTHRSAPASPAASTAETPTASTAESPTASTAESPTASTVAAGPVATESNPPGDIPDNQAFVPFAPPGGRFSVSIPEGWARQVSSTGASFTDKLNRVQVSSTTVTKEPTVATVQSVEVASLRSQIAQFAAGKISTVDRSGQQAILLTYQGDSAPDDVTGKVVRDAFERYTFVHGKIRVDLTLSGPTNADNVDPWRTVSDSVRWGG